MKATRRHQASTVIPLDHVAVTMSETDARELRHQMKAFWENLSVGRQPPSGNSPFAQIYIELGKALGEK